MAYVLGVTPGNNTVAHQLGVYPNTKVFRIFYSGNLPAWTDTKLTSVPSNIYILMSFKTPTGTTYTGTDGKPHASADYVSNAAGWLDQMPASFRNRISITLHHEPEQNPYIDNYKDIWVDFCNQLRGHKYRPYVKLMTIWTEYYQRVKEGGNWQNWWPATVAADIDIMGWDRYAQVSGADEAYATPSTFFSLMRSAATTTGKPFILCEVNNHRHTSDTTGTVAAQWFTDLCTYADTLSNLQAITWFTATPAADFDLEEAGRTTEINTLNTLLTARKNNTLPWGTTGGGSPDTSPPSTPGTPAASNITATGAHLSWAASTDDVGVTSYRVVRIDGTTETIVGTPASNAYDLTGLTGTTTYTFAVYALDAAANVSTRSGTVTFDTASPAGDTTPPSTPGQPSASSIQPTSVVLSWGASTDFGSGVAFYRVVSITGGTETIRDSVTGTATTIGGLTPDTSYTFAVYALDVAGNVSSRSLTVTFSTAATTSGSGSGTPGTPPPPTPTPRTEPLPDDVKRWLLTGLDHTILIMDQSFTVLGDPIVGWTQMDLTLKFNEASIGSFQVPAYPWVHDQLQAGSRIAILRNRKVLMFGPYESSTFTRSDSGSNAGDGMLTVNFTDYLGLIAARLAYPSPTVVPGSQTADYWVRTENAELLMHELVRTNCGPDALAARQIPGLTMGNLNGIGSTITVKAARMEPLGDVLRRAAVVGGDLGFRTRYTSQSSYVDETGTTIAATQAVVFEVFQPRDLRNQVRYSFDLGNLQEITYERNAPTATAALVGFTDGTSRFNVERLNATALTDGWDRVETFVSSSASDTTPDVTQMNTDGDQALKEGDATVRLAVTAIDTPDQRFGIHYGLGDIVAVSPYRGAEVADVVMAVQLQVSPTAGEVATVSIGNQAATSDPPFVKKLRDIDRRIGRLERVTNQVT